MYKSATIPDEVKGYVPPVNLDELLGDLTLVQLNRIFKEVMKRQESKVDPVRSKFGKIEKEEVTLPDKLDYVTEYARSHRKFGFRATIKKAKLQGTGGCYVSCNLTVDEGRRDLYRAGSAI